MNALQYWVGQGVLGALFAVLIIGVFRIAKWSAPRFDGLLERLYAWMDSDQEGKVNQHYTCGVNTAVLNDTNTEVRKQSRVIREMLHAAKLAAQEMQSKEIITHIERAERLLEEME